MSNHMPAPWSLANLSPHDRGPVRIMSQHGYAIGTAYTVDDARVMAAAPELLAALKEELDDHGHLSGRCAAPVGADGCTARCDRIRAAIAKAEGRADGR